MTDYLAELVMRSYGRWAPGAAAGSIRPRLASVFEPAQAGPAGLGQAEIEDVEIDPGAHRPHRGLLWADARIDSRSSGDGPRPAPGRASLAGRTIPGGERRAVAPPPAAPSETEGDPVNAPSTRPAPATVTVRDALLPVPAAGPRESTAEPPSAGVLWPAPVPEPAHERPPSSAPIGSEPSAAPPVVHVTIGRVEVRAVLPDAAPRLPPPPAPARPKALSLTEYLDGGKGNAGGRP